MKKLEIKDKERFDSAYSMLDMPLADLSFSMMYVWRAPLNIRWKDINGNLCVFADFEGSTVLWGPPLPGEKLEATINQCFELMIEKDKKLGRGAHPTIYYIPEELHKAYLNVNGCNVLPQHQDYIYLTERLINLSGKPLNKKKYYANLFKRRYNPSVQPFDATVHTAGCLDLLKRWQGQKKPNISERILYKFYAEALMAEKTVRYANDLDLKGIVVVVDGSIEGFTFGDHLNHKMANMMVEKTNLELPGSAKFIYHEFVKRCWSNYRYINAGEDWGVDYLTQNKLSYKPVKLLKSFRLVGGGKDVRR